eukprot:CAMPEP_0182503152 /NCGR_PEP_ID=MMETSP1321-20130603/14755_1 /TAXON_ID=91990 /ORGANISM="Bolidomonas sp., Strain RCC1657" /LENGTH=371 /DNA_ID=CAMNT_0024708265 /DNA_START=107 /DNA_END=1222 /DNA_ORIENTATION=+
MPLIHRSLYSPSLSFRPSSHLKKRDISTDISTQKANTSPPLLGSTSPSPPTTLQVSNSVSSSVSSEDTVPVGPSSPSLCGSDCTSSTDYDSPSRSSLSHSMEGASAVGSTLTSAATSTLTSAATSALTGNDRGTSNRSTSNSFRRQPSSSFDLTQFQSCRDFDPTLQNEDSNPRQRSSSVPSHANVTSDEDSYGHFIDILPPEDRPSLPTSFVNDIDEPSIKSLLPPSLRDLFWTPIGAPPPPTPRLGSTKRVEVKFRQPHLKPNTTRCDANLKRSIINPSSSIRINGRVLPGRRMEETYNSSRSPSPTSPSDSRSRSPYRSRSPSPVSPNTPTYTQKGRFRVNDYSLTIEGVCCEPPERLPKWREDRVTE